MIAHVVLFRPKADLSGEARQQLADAFAEALRTIPSVRRARVGRRVTIGRDYERLMRADLPFAAIIEFDDVDGLWAYLRHPAHEPVGRLFFDMFEETLIYDFALEEGAEGVRELL
jgi:hypothetical protein